MESKDIIYHEFKGLYKVYPDGNVWSYKSDRFLKQRRNPAPNGYCMVTLTNTKCGFYRAIYTHILVAEHFIGPRPNDGYNQYDINHIDMNKANNHYSNLEYITHQQNIIKARNKQPWISGREKGFEQTEETKLKMRLKKLKKCCAYNDTERLNFESIEQLVDTLKTYRKAFNRYVNSHRTLKGYYIRYI
jgi:hypothetical protein